MVSIGFLICGKFRYSNVNPDKAFRDSEGNRILKQVITYSLYLPDGDYEVVAQDLSYDDTWNKAVLIISNDNLSNDIRVQGPGDGESNINTPMTLSIGSHSGNLADKTSYDGDGAWEQQGYWTEQETATSFTIETPPTASTPASIVVYGSNATNVDDADKGTDTHTGAGFTDSNTGNQNWWLYAQGTSPEGTPTFTEIQITSTSATFNKNDTNGVHEFILNENAPTISPGSYISVNKIPINDVTLSSLNDIKDKLRKVELATSYTATTPNASTVIDKYAEST